MQKNTKLTLGIIFGILVAVVAGYFVAARFGWLPKGKIEYVKESIESTEIKSEEVEQKIEEKSEEIGDGQQPAVEEKKDNVASTIEKKNEVINEEKPKVEVEDKSDDNVGKIVNRLMTSGFKEASDRKIDTIIVHTSYNAIGDDPHDIDDIIKQYKQYEVSAHYLIGRDGTIYRLVKEENIAWHAGVSKMPDGRTNINDFSIGIEVVNTKDGKFSDAEYQALNRLIGDLWKKYPIKNILGHDDIAPGRKTDPWGIDWTRVQK